MRITTRVSFMVMVPMLIVGAREVSHNQRPKAASVPSAASRAADSRSGSTVSGSVGREDISDQGVVDLYGNEITDAVARYKLDAEGSLYEQHSPRTELPRLRPPKS
jgi:hypothetical protein